MDYEDAKYEMLNAFFTMKNTAKKIEVLENYLGPYGEDVSIFPMDDFDTFCVKTWKNEYQKLIEVVEDSRKKYGFDFSDRWCLFNHKDFSFVSSDYLDDFVQDEAKFAEFVADDYELSHGGYLDLGEAELEKIKKVLFSE